MMLGEIQVAYGGSDCSFEYVCITGKTVTVTDLLKMLRKAQAMHVKKVCISERQYDSLIKFLEYTERSK